MSLRRIAFLVVFVFVSLASQGWAETDLQTEVDRAVEKLESISPSELDVMDRATVNKSIEAFESGVSILEKVAQSHYDPDDGSRQRLLERLSHALSSFFIELNRPYANVVNPPESWSSAIRGHSRYWDLFCAAVVWGTHKIGYFASAVGRDLLRALIPFRRDTKEQLVFTFPPVFPRWGNDWARSDATEPMMAAIFHKIEERKKGQGTPLSVEDQRALFSFLNLLQEMRTAESIEYGEVNKWVARLEAIVGPLQNAHPLDYAWLVGMQSENSTWMSAVFTTVVLLLAAKSRVENSGVKGYGYFSRSMALLDNLLPRDCRAELLSTLYGDSQNAVESIPVSTRWTRGRRR